MMENFLNGVMLFIPLGTGMEASEGMYTSFWGLRVLCHHMIRLINILIVMQMRTRSHFILLLFMFKYMLGRCHHSYECCYLSVFSSICYFSQWVSHRNHRGNICGVDFIWLLNPNKSRKPLKTSWCEAVFGIIKVNILFWLFIYLVILQRFSMTGLCIYYFHRKLLVGPFPIIYCDKS